VEVFVNGTGGMLSGSVTLPATSVELTAEGSSDWAHWGLSSPTNFDHKAGFPQQISNFTKIGTNDTQQLQDNFSAFSWSDGTPTAGTNGTKTGVFTYGLNNGFLLTAPADTNSRTLKVYVGLYGAGGKFQSYLRDYSAPAFTDTSLSSVYGSDPAVYTLTYAAASSGQTLIVKYTAQTLFDADYGNVTLQTATLSGGSPPTNAPPTVAITSPTNNATFTAPANISIEADASDADGTISKVEFYSGTTLLGTATNSPYAFIWSGVPAGSYTVTARATDNLGDTATSTAVNIGVTNRTAAAVTIINPTWNGNGFSFSFATASGSTYAIEYKDSLNLISWQSLTNFAGNGTTLSVTNITTTTERFYRVGAQ
jgi:Bacterial Ig domain